MNEYQFTTSSVRATLYFRFRCWIRAVFMRKVFIKRFCFQSGIDYPPIKNKHYKLPGKYQVDTNLFKFIGKARDNEILRQYSNYKQTQNYISQRISELNPEINNDVAYLKDEKVKLEKIKKNLLNANDSLNIISLENAVLVQETKINNLNSELMQKQNELNTLKEASKNNISTWKKQIDINNSMFDSQIEKFIHTVSKKVRDKLNYTEFTYISPEYSNSVKEILNGEINEE